MAGICGKCGGNIQDSIGECVACLHRRIAELKVDRENAVTLIAEEIEKTRAAEAKVKELGRAIGAAVRMMPDKPVEAWAVLRNTQDGD